MLNNAKYMPSILSLVLIAHFKGDVGIALFVPGNCDIFPVVLSVLYPIPTVAKRQTTATNESVLSLLPPFLRSIFRAQLPVRRVGGTGTANAAHARRIVINNGNLGAGKNRT